MDAWRVARMHAAARAILGAALVAAPQPIGAAWVGRDARRPSSRVYSAAVGSRDAALGLGMLNAAFEGRGARPWIAAGIVADATDMLATLRRRDELPRFGVAAVGLMAGTSAALGAWLHRTLE